jgi:hypothetical protein
MRDYTKIEAWRLADDLTVAAYERTRSFPREEIYGLTSQLRRASYSVPANIVEGASRESKKDYLYFLYIARVRYQRLNTLSTSHCDSIICRGRRRMHCINKPRRHLVAYTA